MYVGTSSGVYNVSNIGVGNVTSWTISGLTVGATYYFAVTSIDTSGVQSPFSNEVAVVVPQTAAPASTVASVALATDKNSPQSAGTTITTTATSTGGTAPVSYKFILTTNNWQTWTVLQNWSTTPSVAWTPTQAASYRIGVWARSAGDTADAAEAAYSVPFTIGTPAPAPVTSTTPVTAVMLATDKSSPQTTGTTITTTATSTGGTAPVSYKFILTTNNWQTWTVLQNWSTTASVAWTPSQAGSYLIGVWARSAGNTTDAAQAAYSIPFTIGTSSPAPASTSSSSRVTAVVLATDKSSPQSAGTTITTTATPTGGTAPVSYKFILTTNNWQTWTVLQNWSTTPSVAWTPSQAGSYLIGVWARSAGNTADAAEAAYSIPFTIGTSAPAPAPASSTTRVTAVMLATDKSSPQSAGATITTTATSTGGTTPVSYKFILTTNNWQTWTVLQNWSTTASVAWTPSQAGSYLIGVWARSAGNTADAAEAAYSVPFTIGTSAPAPAPASSTTRVTAVVLATDKSSPQSTGTTITTTATPTGGTAPVSYKFILTMNNWQTWTVLQNWSTTPSVAWTPSQAGSYLIGVWARSAGNTADAAEAAYSVPFTIGTLAPAPAPASATRVTAVVLATDKSSPQLTGATITTTATPTGGTAPVSYKFILTMNNWQTWTVLQNWSTATSVAWTPSQAGSYLIGVWARSAGNTADAAEAAYSVPFTIGTPAPAPAVSVSSVVLTANVVSPQRTKTAITATASSTGGTTPVSYKFILTMNNWQTWTVLQNWSTTASVTWTPTMAGAYRIGVWARSAGNTADTAEAAYSIPFTITP